VDRREFVDSEVRVALRRYLNDELTAEEFSETVDRILYTAGEMARAEETGEEVEVFFPAPCKRCTK